MRPVLVGHGHQCVVHLLRPVYPVFTVEEGAEQCVVVVGPHPGTPSPGELAHYENLSGEVIEPHLSLEAGVAADHGDAVGDRGLYRAVFLRLQLLGANAVPGFSFLVALFAFTVALLLVESLGFVGLIKVIVGEFRLGGFSPFIHQAQLHGRVIHGHLLHRLVGGEPVTPPSAHVGLAVHVPEEVRAHEIPGVQQPSARGVGGMEGVEEFPTLQHPGASGRGAPGVREASAPVGGVGVGKECGYRSVDVVASAEGSDQSLFFCRVLLARSAQRQCSSGTSLRSIRVALRILLRIFGSEESGCRLVGSQGPAAHVAPVGIRA